MENDIDLALAIPITEYSRSVIDIVMNWLTEKEEQGNEENKRESVQYSKLIFNDDQISVLSTFAECIAYFTTEENPDTDAANWDPAKIAQMIYPSPSYILCIYPEEQIGNVEDITTETEPNKESLVYTRVYLIQDILDSIIEAEKETSEEKKIGTKTKPTETPDGL